MPRKATVTQKEIGVASRSLDELAGEIDKKLGAFELQVASLLESTKRGYPPEANKE